MMKVKHIASLLLLLLSLSVQLYAQDENLDSDELFKRARDMAFEKKDYPKAIELCKKALDRSPDYEDIRVFLGRIYIWNDKIDEARQELTTVLNKNPRNKEAISSFIDLEYWNNRSKEALDYCNKGLEYFPNDEELSIKKARVLNDLKQFDEAYKLINDVINRYPQSTDARALLGRIRENAAQNFLSLSYDFIYFDHNYNASLHESPWQIASTSYSVRTKIGTVLGRVSYASRFAENGYQAEIDAYPTISRTFYTYINFGYSPNLPVFPTYRAGFSLYANLPKSFEGEAGFRLLHFTGNTWIYTASVGKYISNYWLNLRTYIVPGDIKFSQSYIITLRRYFGGADDYMAIGVGSGISPDETRSALLNEPLNNLMSYRVNLAYSKVFNNRNIFRITTSWYGEEFTGRPNGNQYDFSITYQRRF